MGERLRILRLILVLGLLGIVALFWMIAADVEPVRTSAVNMSPGVVLTIDSMTKTDQPILTGYEGDTPLIKIGKPGIDISEVETITFALINEERTERGMRELKQVETLMTVARSHSADMADRDYFSHETPEGLGVTQRASIKGYPCRQYLGNSYSEGLSENIYTSTLNKAYTNEELAQKAVESWMGSVGHRRNILDIFSSGTGIGVTMSDDGDRILFTQVFC